jgi:hypothetical protein
MSVPALALIPVLTDIGTGTGASTRTLHDELLERAARDDYHQWLHGTLATGGCTRPIRLRGAGTVSRRSQSWSVQVLVCTDTARLTLLSASRWVTT